MNRNPFVLLSLSNFLAAVLSILEHLFWGHSILQWRANLHVIGRTVSSVTLSQMLLHLTGICSFLVTSLCEKLKHTSMKTLFQLRAYLPWRLQNICWMIKGMVLTMYSQWVDDKLKYLCCPGDVRIFHVSRTDFLWQ
jgi:hypothetical protein